MEGFYVEVSLRKTRWLLCCSYNQIRCRIDFHLENLNRSLALHSWHYENFIIIEDFNVKANDSAIAVLATLATWKALLKSQAAIRTPWNLLTLTLFWLKTAKFPTPLCNRNRFVWFSQDDCHCYEDILWETLTGSSEL